MDDKKQGGFKISYLIIFLVVVLLFCLLFIDFGNNGKRVSWTEALSYVENAVDTTTDEPKASYVYFQNGTGYILVVGSNYAVNQVPDYELETASIH